MTQVKNEFAYRLMSHSAGGSFSSTTLRAPERREIQPTPEVPGLVAIAATGADATPPVDRLSVTMSSANSIAAEMNRPSPSLMSSTAPSLSAFKDDKTQPNTDSLNNSLTGRGITDLISAAATTSAATVSATAACLDLSTPSSRPLVLEVEFNRFPLKDLREAASRGGVDMGSAAELLLDSRWQLVMAYQNSLLGQFMRLLERIASLNSCSATGPLTLSGISSFAQLAAGNNAAAWEHSLRNRCDPRLIAVVGNGSQSSLRPADVQPPIVIGQSPLDQSDDHNKCSWLKMLLKLAAGKASLTAKPQEDSDTSASGISSGSVISDYQLYSAFVFEACQQTAGFAAELFGDFSGAGCDDEMLLDAGQLSLVLQMFHAAGNAHLFH